MPARHMLYGRFIREVTGARCASLRCFGAMWIACANPTASRRQPHGTCNRVVLWGSPRSDLPPQPPSSLRWASASESEPGAGGFSLAEA